MSFQVPEPPHPGFYDIQFGYSDYLFANDSDGVLTCKLCPEDENKYNTDLRPPEDETTKADLHRWLTRHQRQKHPEKLYVLTSAGWLTVEQLTSTIPQDSLFKDWLTGQAKFLHK